MEGLINIIVYGKADTVVFTHAQPSISGTSYADLPQIAQELLEKPTSKADNLRMLLDMSGSVCEIVTGVTVGEHLLHTSLSIFLAD